MGYAITIAVVEFILFGILLKRYIDVKSTILEKEQRIKQLELDNEVLRKQRDNNVTGVDGADGVWDNWKDN